MSENMKKIRKALIGISLCSKNSMSSKAECGSLAREALLILDAHVAALSEQDVEGFIKNTPCLVLGERFYSESDLRTWMAGHVRVPVEVVSHYDALQFLIEPLKAAKGKGMTAQEACAALSAWDKARNIKGAASREGAIPGTHRVVSVADLECVIDELGDAGWYTRAEQLRAIIDNKEQQ